MRQVSPAEQAGTTAAGLIFEDFEDLFLFTDSSLFLGGGHYGRT
ncbi:MAG: hypothetical protein ACI9DF_004797 [Verrucomicrobiales bacterium]|jgi:hypothetical protein